MHFDLRILPQIIDGTENEDADWEIDVDALSEHGNYVQMTHQLNQIKYITGKFIIRYKI